MSVRATGLPARVTTVLAALVFVAAACTSTADQGDGELVVYERVWPDSITETTTIYQDGRVSMLHGEHLERFTLAEADLQLIRSALEAPLEPAADAASDPDAPRRTITLGDGTIVQVGEPEPEGAVDLLDRLTDTHSFSAPDGAAHEPGSSPEHSHDEG